MSQPTNPSASRWTPPREQHDWGAALLTSPWLWGAAMTVGFYQAIPLFPSWNTFFDRYFCQHWILYTETAGAFFGLAILMKKLIGLFAERRAFESFSLDQVHFEPHVPSETRALSVAQSVSAAPASMLRTQWLKRIIHVCEYVLNRRSAQGLEEHLRYRADLALESLTGSFAFLRTITWAIPILGFLGTVIGITMSLSSLKFDPNQLAESFEQALVGLGVAFDTTALALSLSLGLVFGTYMVERAEGDVLGRVEELGVARLAPLLPATDESVTPLAAAETQAASHLLERTESLVNWQTEMWQSALEGMRTRWIESADSQQGRFNEALQQGMLTTLTGHAQDLQSVRGEFLEGFRSVAQELSRVVVALQTSTALAQSQFGEQVASTWKQLETHLNGVHAQQQTFLADASRLLGESMSGWHGDLERSTSAMQAQLTELRQQSQLLLSLSEQTGELEQLQSTLTNNLQTVRTLNAFEETIQSLNAAIHLLSARSKGFSAAA